MLGRLQTPVSSLLPSQIKCPCQRYGQFFLPGKHDTNNQHADHLQAIKSCSKYQGNKHHPRFLAIHVLVPLKYASSLGLCWMFFMGRACLNINDLVSGSRMTVSGWSWISLHTWRTKRKFPVAVPTFAWKWRVLKKNWNIFKWHSCHQSSHHWQRPGVENVISGNFGGNCARLVRFTAAGF